MTARKFWEYRESDGTITNVRVKFLVACVLAGALLGTVAALLSGIHDWWPIIPIAAVIAAVTATAIHANEYIRDRKEGTK